MKKNLILIIGCFWLISCLHRTASSDRQRPLPAPIFRSDVAIWIDYINNLEAMPPKDLKNEYDRLRRISDRSWDEELRLSLANSLQLQKIHNYQKASELVGQATSKIQGNSDLRSWLKLYGQQVNTIAQLDKELTEEKRLRSELEKKLKALSDIERDISERSKKIDSARP